MKVSQTIKEKLLNDKDFRLNTALKLDTTERTIMNYAHAGSDNLTKYAAVKYFKKCGFSEKEIFEEEHETLNHES
jgi:hypothetical protein